MCRAVRQDPYRLLIVLPVYLSPPGGRLSTVDPTLSNRDLAPTTPAQRTWTTYNYIALWFSMSMEITTYQLASSLIAKGMDWKQAVGTVLLGNLIVLVPMLLNAHAGAQVRDSVSSVHSRAIRSARRESAGDSARGRRLRLVRHSVMDRRHGHPLDARGHLARNRRRQLSLVGVLPRLLAAEHGRLCGAASNRSATCRPLARPSCSSWPRRC